MSLTLRRLAGQCEFIQLRLTFVAIVQEIECKMLPSTRVALRAGFIEAGISVGSMKLCFRGSRRLLMDRREVIVDGREILRGVSFPHCEAIQFFRSIG